ERARNRRVEVFLSARLPMPPSTRKGPLLLPPEILGPRPFLVIHYAPNKATITPFDSRLIERVARYVTARATASSPISAIRLVGHTEALERGSAGFELGRRRASNLASAFATALDRERPGLSRRVRIVVQSAGASRPSSRIATPAARGRNRRVEVFLAVP